MSFSSDTKRELSALNPNRASEDALSLRRLFLEKGTMTNPTRDYHMEFACASLEEAQALCSFLEYLPELSVTPGVTKRKGQYVVYVKGSEQITDFLAFIGANKAAMEFMQVKMVKEVRNYVNRTTNFETANIGKTASAAAGQLEAIRKIQQVRGLASLPEELRELAELRLENPEFSLRELGESLTPSITRSGVNHRMKRLLQIADEIFP